MQNLIKTSIFNLFTILLGVTPLLFTHLTGEGFEFPKIIFVYVISSTIIFLFCVNWVLYDLKPFDNIRKNNLNILIFLFIGINLVSLIFSSHFYTSIWGYYTRFNNGIISLVLFFGLFLVLNFFKEDLKKTWVFRFNKIICLSLIPIGIFSIFQHFGFITQTHTRVYGTFGQPNWLGAYVIMVLPLIMGNILNTRSTSSRIFWVLVWILGFCSLWFSYSLSGILGFIASLGFFIYLNKKSIFQNIKIISVSILIATSIVSLNLGIFSLKIQDGLKDLNFKKAQSDYYVSDPVNIRKHLWKSTINMLLSKPKTFIIGTGPETFPYEFQNFRSPKLNFTSEWDFVFNKPHNYYLEIFSQTGILSLILYLCIIGISIKKAHPIISPALLGLYVTNIFGWPTVATSLLFWMFLSFVASKNIWEIKPHSSVNQNTNN